MSTDPRRAKIHEAQRLRDLGFYNKAAVLYEKLAASDQKDCFLILEYASMKVEQGLIGDSREKLEELSKLLDHQDADEICVALYDMLKATVTVIGEVKFGSSIDTLQRIFHEQIEGRVIEQYNKRAVSITVLYHTLCALRTVYGYMPKVPVQALESSIILEIFGFLIKEERYAEALRVARIAGHGTNTDETDHATKQKLLREIMNHPDVPDLIRAETIIEYAECLQETSTSDEWVGQMEEASKTYDSVGHAYGVLSVRAKLLEKRIPKTSAQKAGEELLRIKKSMEEVGYWTGAIDALRAYAQLQMHEFGRLEEDTLVEIDSELLRFKEICKNNFDWVSQTNLNFTRWQQSGANVGKGLEVLEKMYADMSDMEAPFLIADTLMKLYEAYTKIGDTASAMACLGRRPEVLPRRMVILLGLDPFYQRLQGGTEVLDHESELSALRGEIEKAEGIIKNTASLQDRGNEVLRLSHISNLYLIHWNLRPINETRSLIEPCLEAIHSATKHLDKSQASLWTINALQTEARLLFNESHLSAIQKDKLKLMQQSLELHEKTFVMFRDVGHKFNMSLAKQSIALCYDSIWQFNGKPSRSDDFEKAASSYEEAKVLLKDTGNFGSEQMITRLLMLLWYRGLQQGVLVKTWFGLSTTSPMQMTLKYVEEAERLATIERCDMAALKPERAVLAKQALRKDDNAQAVYDVAIQVHNHVEDHENTWNWIQRSKARSVSDMLALGVNLPADLVSEIDQHPELREQMDQERSLLESIGEAQSSEKIYLQKQLDALRKKMRTKPIFQKVLDLREGQPVSVADLRDLGKRRAAEGQSRVVFVDWVAINGHIHCLIVSESRVKKLAVGLTVEDATEWKKNYLRQDGRKNHPLEEDEMPENEIEKPENQITDNAPPHNPIAALRELFKYVQEVVQETKDGDLLVFCPAGVLHGMPLHAAIIDENSDTSLIERNPIVYTSSMTTLEHCASRQLYGQRTATNIDRSFIAVFEETESGAFGEPERATRDQIYSSIRKIATKNPGSSSLFGNEASLSSVSQAFDADFVYFFGHCDFEQQNMLHQGLVLAPEADDSGTTVSPRFTALDMFKTRIRASNVMLMACASASESHSQGDEPLGITTSLLCAGASSITGTLWKVKVDTAAAFTTAFNNALTREKSRDCSTVDLARVVQAAICRLKKRPDTRAPFDWASFVLHGSWFMQK